MNFFKKIREYTKLICKVGTVVFLPVLVLSVVNMAKSVVQQQSKFSQPEHGTKLAEGNTQFAIDMYKSIAMAEKGNIFFSPGSISIALAMTYLGARSNTAAEMKSVMGLTELEDDNLHQAFQELSDALMETGGNYTLHIANRLYAQKSYNFLQEFLDKQKKYYKASLAPVDFQTQAEQARVEINKWVEEQTRNKITDLLKPGTIDLLTRLVLINAIYFKGDWEQKFDKKRTSPGDFFLNNDDKIQVPMMKMKKKFNFGVARELNDLKVLELPYVGNKMSMVILLPSKVNGVSEVVDKLTAAHLVDPLKAFKMRKVEVEVSLPKFKLEQSLDLGDTLKSLGIKDLFTDGADLSGIDGGKNLVVSKVVHKAFIEVNEEGSEAAAATGVQIMLMSMPAPPPKFTVDREALFFIWDKITSSVLFFGRLNQPSG